MPNYICLVLTNGEIRHIDAPDGVGGGIVEERLGRMDIVQKEWVRTLENTVVHRSHIVEALLVADGKQPKRLAEFV